MEFLLFLYHNIVSLFTAMINMNIKAITIHQIIAVIVVYLLWRFCIYPISIRLLLFIRFRKSLRNKKYAFARVVKVLDGDTIEVRLGLFKLFTVKRIRFKYIDAPEKNQPYGKQASNFVLRHSKGNIVLLILNENLDKYGRTLAEVYCGHLKHSLNYTLVERGLAWAYQANKFYQVAEQTAKRKKKGFWKQKNAINPAQWRKDNK